MAFKRSSVRSRPAPPDIFRNTAKLGCTDLAVSLFQEDDCVFRICGPVCSWLILSLSWRPLFSLHIFAYSMFVLFINPADPKRFVSLARPCS